MQFPRPHTTPDSALSPDDLIRRGNAAKALLENPTLGEAFETVLHDVTRKFLATKRVDMASREELHAQANAIMDLRAQLQTWLNDAVLEQERINRADRRKEGTNNG